MNQAFSFTRKCRPSPHLLSLRPYQYNRMINTPGRCISRAHLIPVIFLLLSCYGRTNLALCNGLDRNSLLSFSSNTLSQSPLNWSVSIDCCFWEGIGCDKNGRVIHLWLPSRGLMGTISPSLGNLSQLAQLNLSHNWLSGHLPDGLFASLNHIQMVDLSFNLLSGNINSTISLYKSIQIVDLSSNYLSGRIPSSFLQLSKNLLSFNASNNTFSGALPSFICRFSPSTRVLDFSFNSFNGSISDGFGRCSNLKVLRAGFNLLRGPLPDDLFDVLTLQELSLPGNRLNGYVGEGIANLPYLQILALYANEFTGVIPRDIGKLSNLKHLLLHVNQLNGTLPSSLMNCTSLVTLNLRLNFLTGELSSFDFSRFIQLYTIDFGNNFFNGTFPTTLTSCTSLTAIRLSSNQLEGQIPLEIQRLQFLSFFSLSNNSLINVNSAISNLSGIKSLRTLILSKNFYNESLTFDPSLVGSKGFRNLQVLALGGCQLNGEIPICLSKLSKLEVLDFSFNRFTGPVPNWLADLPKLFYLDLSQNILSGYLPKELMSLPRLTLKFPDQFSKIHLELPVYVQPNNISSLLYNKISGLPPAIYLNNNDLSGDIPEEIGLLIDLQVLDLSYNKFSGEIPNAISKLTNLEKLDLSYNSLHGQIPVALRNLHFLSSFSVANNLLEGTIPTGGQLDTFPPSSFEGNPRLCGRILQRSCSPMLTPQSQTGNKSSRENFPLSSFRLSFAIGFGVSFSVSVQTFYRLSRSPKFAKFVFLLNGKFRSNLAKI